MPGNRVREAAAGREATLAAFLLGCGEPPPIPLLREKRLAAYAYTAVPPDHPARAELRAAYLAALARHHDLKGEILPLLAAWREAGIDVLLFKGFHLAEFVYPAPGMRFHGDVDVLIGRGCEEEASAIARRLGWAVESDTARVLGRPYAHGAFNLVRVDGAAQVDVHRWILHCPSPWNAVQRRITAAVWANSVEREWEGVRIRELASVDALLVGLILQRCWGGDRWRLKPCDVLDFRLLAERRGVTPEALHARARELGCTRTLARFLERCNPREGRLDLRPPGRASIWRLGLGAWRERRPYDIDLAAARLRVAPRALLDLIRELPRTLAAIARLRLERDVRRLLDAVTPTRVPTRRATEARRFRTVRGIRLATRLLPTFGSGKCLVRSVATYAALRRQGWPVEFVSGVRRDGGDVRGHAWLELGGRPLPELGEPANRTNYRIVLRYPPASAVTARD